jgi:hypothetical protein
VFWACLGLVGALQFLQFSSDLSSGIRIGTVAPAVAAAVMSLIGAFGVVSPERAGGPERPGPALYAAVLAVALLLGGLILA